MAKLGETNGRRLASLRAAGVTLVVLLGAAALVAAAFAHEPLKDWLFFRYATYWLLSAGIVVSGFASGLAILRRIWGSRLPLGEQLVAALPTGLLAFTLLLFVLGLVGQLNAVTFVLAPLLGLLLGARTTFRLGRRLFRRRRSFARAPSIVTYAALAYGVVALLLLYAEILMPDNVSYDARWYHMAIAESYSVTGHIVRFREGWMLGGFPQFATLIYTWAFLLPGGSLFDKIELAQHLEFSLFLATLAQIPVMVRRIAPRDVRASGASWVALFLFPGIFVYDSNLNGGADHIAALWAVPFFLSFLRLCRRFEAQRAVFFAAMAAGVMHTKFTAYSLLVLPLCVVLVQTVVVAVRSTWSKPRDFGWVRSVLGAVATVLVLWSPVWLKNLIWYGDPLYPMLRSVFHSRPWVHTVPAQLTQLFTPKDWAPEHSLRGLSETLESLYKFSFVSYDWATFHRDLPVFGFLFTLTVPLLPFFLRARRLLLLYASCHVGVLFWFFTAHQDRYLQVQVPLMAAGVAAVLGAVWQMGWAPRLATALLVGLQVAWGADVPFFPTHAMMGESPLKAAVEFVGGGLRNARTKTFQALADFQGIRAALPKGAVLLLHEEPLHLGVGVPTVSDWFQTQIDYSVTPSPDKMFDLFRSYGVTHLLASTGGSRNADTVGGDIAFRYFMTRFGAHPAHHGPYTLAEMPSVRPDSSAFKDRALYLGCRDAYVSGVYAVSALTVPTLWGTETPRSRYPAPLRAVTPKDDIAALAEGVDAVYHDPKCFKTGVAFSNVGFVQAATRQGFALWIRKKP